METRLVCLFLLASLASALAAPELVNEDVKRTVDLSTHLAKVTTELSLANPPGGSGSTASFLLALDPGLESHLAYLGVQVSSWSLLQPLPNSGGPRGWLAGLDLLHLETGVSLVCPSWRFLLCLGGLSRSLRSAS